MQLYDVMKCIVFFPVSVGTYKKYKNRPRNAGVIIENKVRRTFLWLTGYSDGAYWLTAFF